MTGEVRIGDARLEGSLIDMAIESWRFSRMVARLISKLDAGDGARYMNQLRYFQRKIEEHLEAGGLKLNGTYLSASAERQAA
ncbi:MAG: hypothetical protein ACRDRL_05575 [Sciscionella sp.]